MQEKIEYSLTLEEVLNNKKYTVNYYQREYRWGRKQIEQLIDDLTNAFEDSNGKVKATELTDVEGFDYYYMGTIIVTGSTLNLWGIYLVFLIFAVLSLPSVMRNHMQSSFRF